MTPPATRKTSCEQAVLTIDDSFRVPREKWAALSARQTSISESTKNLVVGVEEALLHSVFDGEQASIAKKAQLLERLLDAIVPDHGNGRAGLRNRGGCEDSAARAY